MRTQTLAIAFAMRHVFALPLAADDPAAAATPSTTMYTLPNNDPNQEQRKAGVAWKRGNFIYGPSILGNTTFYPTGALGKNMSMRDMELWRIDSLDQTLKVEREQNITLDAILKVSFGHIYVFCG